MNTAKIEREIVGKLVDDVLAAGFRISVSLERGYDTEEMLKGSRDKEKIMEEAFAGDDCHIFVHEAEGEILEEGRIVSKGWVYIVLGNDGYDVISDYSVNLEELLKGSNALADSWV